MKTQRIENSTFYNYGWVSHYLEHFFAHVAGNTSQFRYLNKYLLFSLETVVAVGADWYGKNNFDLAEVYENNKWRPIQNYPLKKNVPIDNVSYESFKQGRPPSVFVSVNEVFYMVDLEIVRLDPRKFKWSVVGKENFKSLSFSPT